MMEMRGLWDQACDLLKSEMNRVSFKTWIGDNLTPERLEGDRQDCQTLLSMR